MGEASRDDTTVTLYAAYGSLCSVKVRTALIEKGVDFVERRVNIGPMNEHFQPWYARLNPRLVVPTLDDRGRIICDSAVIIRYIDANFDGPILSGQDEAEREMVSGWIDRIDALDVRAFSMSSFLGGRMRHIVKNVMGPYRIHEARRLQKKHPELAAVYQSKIDDYQGIVETMSTPEQIAVKKAAVHACLDDLEGALSETPFVVGADYSFADLMATGLIARVKLCGAYDAAKYPNLSTYYTRMKARPGFAASGFVERADRGEMFRLIAPFVLPRLAAVSLVLIGLGVAIFWLI